MRLLRYYEISPQVIAIKLLTINPVVPLDMCCEYCEKAVAGNKMNIQSSISLGMYPAMAEIEVFMRV